MHCTGKLCSRAAQRTLASSTHSQPVQNLIHHSKPLARWDIVPKYLCSHRLKLQKSSISQNTLLTTRHIHANHVLPNYMSNCAFTTRASMVHFIRPFRTPGVMCQQPCRSLSRHVVIKDGQVVDAAKIKSFCDDNEMIFKEGHACIVTTCPRFTRRRLKLDELEQLYINKTTGFFVCHSCKRSGTWDKLEDNVALLQDSKDNKRRMHQCFHGMEADESEGKRAREFWETTVPLDSIDGEKLDRLRHVFAIEGISLETLKKFQVHSLPNSDVLVFPIFAVDGVVSAVRILTYTAPDSKTKTKGKKSSRTIPRVDFQGLFGWNTCKSGDKVAVLTSNELDAMAAYQETGTTALALPKGTSTLPQKVLPLLEQYSSIILWLGEDMHSWVAAKQFARKLGEKRCSLIRPDSRNRAPLSALRQGDKLPSILRLSRPIIHDSIASFKDLRQDVFTELSQAEQMAGTKWKKFPRLTELLKGHRRGELTVFTGPTGSGKTTFISEYSLDLCQQGVNTLWGSFEINNVRLLRTMLTQYSQINLTKNLQAFDQYADSFELLPMYFMTFHGEENIKKVIETMSHAVYIHDINHVIVDNLQFMMGTSNLQVNDRYSKQDALIASFRKFATQMNCHVTLVIHPRKERDTDELSVSSIFGSAKATQEADNVLILQDRRLTSLRARKYLQVVKNRYDGDLGVMVLRFNKEAISFALKPKDKTETSTKKSKEETLKDSLDLDTLIKSS